jgi:ribosomal protein S26
MMAKIYRKRGKNKKELGEERTNPCKNCTLSQKEF